MKLYNIFCIFVLGLMLVSYSQTAEAIAVAPFFSIQSHNSNTIAVETKKCTVCNIKQSLDLFYLKNTGYLGRSAICKSCTKKKELIERRTVRGVVFKAYYHQRDMSKKRGHDLPSYSKEQLLQFALSTNIFHSLYSDWVDSEYSLWLKPSFDRRDDYKPYTLDNLQITTWGGNNCRSHSDRVNGINTKNAKTVLQYDSNMNLVNTFYSARNAGRVTGVSQGNISAVCRGEFPKANGFIWRYKTQT